MMDSQLTSKQFDSPHQTPPCAGAAAPRVPWWKRGLDLLLLVVLAPVVVPVGILIAVYIKLVSKGPVLFSQTRIGFAGKPFTCFKFRSMKTNACVKGHEAHLENLMASNTPMTKLDSAGDSRLIPGAALLRASGLDELAQLLNVVKGDMSIVGPRPCLPYEFALYTDRHKERLNALPGITGLWQVSGKNETTFEEMIDIDIDYSKRQSSFLDVRIIAKTFFVLLKQISTAIFRKPSKESTLPNQDEVPERKLTHVHADN